MVRGELYGECVRILDEAMIPDSEFDTLCVFQDMLGDKNPLFKPREEVSAAKEAEIRELISRRCEGVPLQYLLGIWEFWGCPIKVGDGVLIPRPDTETLVEDIIELCRKKSWESPKIVDLCSGSGCIAIALKKELPAAEIYAAELSERALGYLKENAGLNGTDIKIMKADVLSPETAMSFRDMDIIVSNPPYLTEREMGELQREVAREPSIALYGGKDGLSYYRQMTPIWKNSLKTGGYLCYEFGMGQEESVGKILSANGFGNISFSKDAGGIIRTVSAELEEKNG